MAKKKKKKTPQSSTTKDFEVTKSYFDKFSEVARKTLRLIDLDPALYDRFTKKQKIEMMRAKMTVPRVVVKKGHAVPRQYVKMVQQEMHKFMNFYPVGNPEIGLFYSDFIIYGMAFLTYIQTKGNTKNYCEQSEAYKLIAAKASQNDEEFENNFMFNYWQYAHYLLLDISKINFRIYGFEWEWKELDNICKFAGHIILTSCKAEKLHFTYRNKVRPAFRAMLGQFISSKPVYLSIPYNKIIEESEQTHLLEVYVQSHALARMKERLDLLEPIQRNSFLTSSLYNSDICQLHNGQLVIKFTKEDKQPLGYLPFTIINKQLFILTFLPICSQNAPEGKKLQEQLGISRNEIEFLGMDKLSFFRETDFEAIPRLKEAVIEAGLWHLTELKPLSDYQPQNHISSSTIARFFQTERSHEEVLSEIEERY
ncbi:MAG: hypothetical protein QM800_00280 [Paludibacter sp.]